MARYFKNPEGGTVEEVDGFQVLATLFLGVFYLFFAELWWHLLVWVGAVCLGVLLGGPWLGVAILSLHIIYAFLIRKIVASAYLKKGWVEVQEPKK